MFPVTLDELIPAENMCRVIEAFVERLDMAKLEFVRAEPAETGRPGYDPRDLLKLGCERHWPANGVHRCVPN
jgi:transposase